MKRDRNNDKKEHKEVKIGKYLISSNWKLLLIIMILFIIGICFLIIGLKKDNPINNDTKKCISDEDCIRVDIGCCPCSAGGEDRCALKYEIIDIEKNKGICSGILCAQVYNCHVNNCICIEGKCKET